ncbi:hypothetical protein CEXT_227211 [Caerostris extrusa]|uniref:Uncharacterized protein n=1 Tax=Caerostris extrusa TaxID=172846 RepID=A0AAV4NB35_CAEEX|nr:hypothetical protein CEXT_227211 [Caerostris extrusa]
MSISNSIRDTMGCSFLGGLTPNPLLIALKNTPKRAKEFSRRLCVKGQKQNPGEDGWEGRTKEGHNWKHAVTASLRRREKRKKDDNFQRNEFSGHIYHGPVNPPGGERKVDF